MEKYASSENEVIKFHRSELPAPSRFILGLKPYDVVSSLDDISRLPAGLSPLKLDWNESVIPPSGRVVEEISKFLKNGHHLNWYPDLGASKLCKTLAAYCGVDSEDIIVTNGSDDALSLICASYLDPEDDVVVVWPTYGHFVIFVRGRGIEPRMATPDDVFDSPYQTLMNTIHDDTKLVYIASPNNPTGVVTRPEEVQALCQAFPSTLFVVDEAYYEFCRVTSAWLVDRCPNLIVTRTFSKCLSMAGLRVGYLMTSGEVLGNLKRLYNPKSVNVLGQVGAAAAMMDYEFISHYVNDCLTARKWVVQEMAARGADVRSTQGNYFLVRVRNPADFCKKLKSVGVFVRDRSFIKGFEGYVRITVGPMDYMKEFTRRIDMLLEKTPHLLEPWSIA